MREDLRIVTYFHFSIFQSFQFAFIIIADSFIYTLVKEDADE